jgi:tetratricopeptide (TPR) repeat protein
MFTFLFTDIEGSTALLGRVGQGVYARVLADHHAIIRSGLAGHGGREVDTQGDAFFAVFSSPAPCVAAVLEMQLALQYDQYLLTEPAAGRYRMHDQIREHARALAGRAEPEDDRDQATARLLDYYQHTANLADTLLARQARATPAPIPVEVPALSDQEQALSLYRDLGNRGGAVTALNEAGMLSTARGDLRQAGSCHQQALDLARQIGSSWDEAHALTGLGQCALAAGRTAEAEAMLRQAAAIFQRIGAAEAADVSAELDALTAVRPTSHES